MQATLDHNQSVKSIMAEFIQNVRELKIKWQDNFKPNMIYGRYELRYEKDDNQVLVRTIE